MTTLIKKYIFILFLFAGLSIVTGNHLMAQNTTTYQEAVKQADKKYAAGKLMDAKGYYQMALKLKKDDPYSKKKIKDIIDKLSQQMDKEDEYYDVIDKADIYFDQNAFDKALGYYRDALKIIPNDNYAKERIQKILDIRANEKAKLENYNKLMADGNLFCKITNLMTPSRPTNRLSCFSPTTRIHPNKLLPPTT